MRTLSMPIAASLIVSTAGTALAQKGTDAMLAAGARLEAGQAQANALHLGVELLTCMRGQRLYAMAQARKMRVPPRHAAGWALIAQAGK